MKERVKAEDMYIEISNLSVSYNGTKALENINTKVELSKMSAVIGPNGAGKSTFIKAMLGLIPSSKSAKVSIGDNRLKAYSKNIAYIEQRNNLDLSFPISVEEVVMLGTYGNVGLFKHVGKKEKEIVNDAIKRVELEGYEKRQISQLSGGQFQRVLIARALAQQADIYLLDEPFIGIDALSESLIMDVLSDLQKQGKTIIIVVHDLHKIENVFDNIIIVNKSLIASGKVEDEFNIENINSAYGKEIGGLVFKEDEGVC